ncbi:TetR/AcrR family transcriptional regulator C-terminal domain-containing protein [Virgibacillus oceani]
MVKKRNLSIQKIIDMSISLINEKGLEALTMRKLATKLNVQASAVYWHVKNKEELLQLLSIKISEKISYPNEELDWKLKLIHLAKQSRDAMNSIRNGPEIMMRTIPTDPYRLGLIEYMIKVLTEEGFTPLRSLEITNLLNNYTILFTIDEFIRIEQQNNPSTDEYIQAFWSNLSEKYPYFNEAIKSEVENQKEDEVFQSGLIAILDGYELQKIAD